MNLKNKDISYKTVIIISAFIGMIIFLLIYGVEVLDVTNDSWLVNRAGDLSAHYIGWLYYRRSPWQFPIGLLEGITYPYKFSVIYMDSIPIFALFFKILSPILPVTFQYFGLYGLFTYILQSILGAKLIYLLTKNTKASIIGSAFFALSSTLIQRMFGHSALAFHPIILLAMLLFFEREIIIEKKRDILYWSLLLILACSIQAYFVPMVFAFIAAFYLPEVISSKWYRGFIKIIIPIIVTLLVMYLWGYFYGSHELNGGGLGAFNSNLNVFFDDQGNSLIAEIMGKISTGGIWEAYVYLGIGVIILSIICIYDILQKKRYKLFNKKYVPIIVLVSVFVCVSIFPIIRLGQYTIFEFPLSETVENLFGTFRANGRFMWPVMYLIILGVIVYVTLNFKRTLYYLLIFCFIIQIIDLSKACIIQHDRINTLLDADSKLKSNIWKQLNKNELFFFYEPVGGAPMEVTTSLGKFANDNSMVMNDFYTSRKDSAEIQKDKAIEKNKILEGKPDDKKLYIFNEVPLDIMLYNTNLHIYDIDGIIIGITDILYGQKEISITEGIDLLIYCNSCLIGGEKEEDGYHIKRGEKYNIKCPAYVKGIYHIEIRGDNFDNILLSATTNDGNTIKIENLQETNECVSFDITLDDLGRELILDFNNQGKGEIYLSSLNLKTIF